MTSKPVGKVPSVADDERVQRWNRARKLNAPGTAEVQMGNLRRLLDHLGISVSDFIEEAREHPAKLEDELTAWVQERRKEGRLDAYLWQVIAAAKSFFEHEEVVFNHWPELKPRAGASLSSERVPTPQEVGLIRAALPTRWAAAALLIAHSGLRPGVLCDNDSRTNGARALQLKHLPDLQLKPKPRFVKVPFRVVVPEGLSKTGASYITFGGQESADALLTYLGERTHLTSDSFVISGKTDGFQDKPVTVDGLAGGIRKAIEKVVPDGTTWRPYVLRAFAETRWMLAESRGLIVRDVREHFLGHNTGVAGRYTVGKRLSEDTIEEMRTMYERSLPVLESAPARTAQEIADEVTMKRTIIEGYGRGVWTPRQKEAMQSLTWPEFGTELAKVVEKDVPKVPTRRIVTEAEYEKLLGTNWRMVGSLPSGKLEVELRA